MARQSAREDSNVGEPDTVKAVRPVRRGTVGNVITTLMTWITRAGGLPYGRGHRFEFCTTHIREEVVSFI